MKIGMVIRRNPLLLALAAAAAAVMLVISEGSYFRSVSNLNALGAMASARSSLRGLERSFLDAETEQRGYLLTDRTEYLQPYVNALQEIDNAFRFLQQYYADEPEALIQLIHLRKASDMRLSELALTISLHQQGRETASVSPVQPILLAIDSIAAHCDGYWSFGIKNHEHCALDHLGGKLRGLPHHLHSQSKEPPQNPRRFKPPRPSPGFVPTRT